MVRLLPEQPLPAYAFVPGRHPHPGPASHPAASPTALDCWRAFPLPESCLRWYLFGIDLFNHGYYWEAHECWEQVWNACGRKGQLATLMKGLIKLAAAGVKVREGKRAGVQGHARRAAELLAEVRQSAGGLSNATLGLDLASLIAFAQNLAENPYIRPTEENAKTESVLDLQLCPHVPEAR